MWNWIKANPTLSSTIFAGIGTIVFSAISFVVMFSFRLWLKQKDHTREIETLWKKHHEDIQRIEDKHQEDKEMLRCEIDDLKDSLSVVNIQVLEKIDKLSEKMDKQAESIVAAVKGVARIEGWIAGQNKACLKEGK